MIRRLAAAIAMATFVTQIGAADPKSELELMQGTWKISAAEMGGEKIDLSTTTLTIEKDAYTVKVGEQLDKGILKLDPSKSPRAMDIVGKEGPNKGKTFLAIYELKDDSIKICYALEGKRPTDFTTKGDKRLFMATYKKAK